MKVLDDAFELAIDRADFPKDGELCLRSVSVPVRLRLDSSEQSLTAHWTAELAQSLADVIRNGPTARRVFYYSRRQAVFDFALGVARGEYERAWAWQLLGLWQGRETIDDDNALRQLVHTFRREADLIVPAFRYVASLGSLPDLSRKLSSDHWRELSEAASVQAGVVFRHVSTGPLSSRVLNYALSILKRSQILGAISYSGVLAQADEATRRAIAVLGIFDAEPALLHSQVAPRVIEIVASSIGAAPVNEQSFVATETAPVETSEIAPVETSEMISQETACSTDLDDFEATRPKRREEENPNELSRRAFAERAAETNDILDPRRRARTDYGGLLYLIAVIDLLELPEEILADPVLGVRPLSWILHQLAMTLAPTNPKDAAALAFAGLLPDAASPSETEPPATASETYSISMLATRIVEYLSSLILEYASTADLVEFVCHRNAEIVADPGWIEIRFALDQVATEIRRAGLDLDPGYVKWLGVVVKFVYE
jgi:hypothetical protein